ncbi:uncharacterized protein LOC127750835 [Frankliniella occidentalis]|uniref:Uncharacterized protein LOC127750835 n=1 Tax=Frankliniella occidentalis TaxID=133901 RepID=A0A9C6XST5_FRAOC|nr:uncharacterized protein LOC127750835 [Frankliniella occidentalis]
MILNFHLLHILPLPAGSLDFLRGKMNELNAARAKQQQQQAAAQIAQVAPAGHNAGVVAPGQAAGAVLPPNVPPPAPAINQNDIMAAIMGAVAQLPGNVNQPAAGPSHEPDQVKIGKCLTLSKTGLIQAKAARTGTAMTMYLVRAPLSKRRLMRSTYAGQKRRNGQKPALKKYQLMRDIQDFVLQRFPHLSQANFGSAVNACTGERAAVREEAAYDEVISSDED